MARSQSAARFAAPEHPLATRRAGTRRLSEGSWVLRKQEAGTREAADRWLTAHLDRVDISLELGNDEAVKRAVASGPGLGRAG